MGRRSVIRTARKGTFRFFYGKKQNDPFLFAIFLIQSILFARSGVPNGGLEEINGFRVVSVWGTPEEMGTAYGSMLAGEIKRVIKDIITDGIAGDMAPYDNTMAGSAIMKKHQPGEFIAGTEGVPIESRNLHSIMIDATSLRFIVAMGGGPAYKLPYREFRLAGRGVEK